MYNGQIEAGGDLTYVYDPDTKKVKKFYKVYTSFTPVSSEKEILENQEIKLVANAIVPSFRGTLSLRFWIAVNTTLRLAFAKKEKVKKQ